MFSGRQHSDLHVCDLSHILFLEWNVDIGLNQTGITITALAFRVELLFPEAHSCGEWVIPE